MLEAALAHFLADKLNGGDRDMDCRRNSAQAPAQPGSSGPESPIIPKLHIWGFLFATLVFPILKNSTMQRDKGKGARKIVLKAHYQEIVSTMFMAVLNVL